MSSETPTSLAIEIEGSMRAATDELLTLAARSGNSSAFVELGRRHSKRIQHRIYGILGNWEDAEDALQDSMLKAFRHLDQFRGNCKFSTWLTTIAVNSALMLIRKRRTGFLTSYSRTADGSDISESWDLPDNRPGPEHLCAGREMEELLRCAIQMLPGSHRTTFELYYARNYSTNKIAQALGISVGATKSRLLRARKTLRASLSDFGFSTSYPMLYPTPSNKHRMTMGHLKQPSRSAKVSRRGSYALQLESLTT